MPISFACPECDHAIKAPDELAGRRVKCPSCKAAVSVPARAAAKRATPPPAEDEESRPAPSKQAARREPPRRPAPPPDADDPDDRPRRKPPRDDEDDADDGPRRKPVRDDEEARPRRKAKSGNKGLVIGLCISGGVLVVGGVVLAIILLSGGSDSKKGGGGAAPADPAVKTHLMQIGIAYHGYVDAFRKAPSNAEDLRPFLEGGTNPTFTALTNGTIVFIYGVRLTEMPQGTSHTIVAYEKDVPTRGGPVLFGDGLVREMDAAEFARTPKAGKR